ncbi:DUF58 domain-containing protein [Methanoregula sp.]|uniref:DUF58 domain-containing protein n=1 Tax=Methanoregula sp. TaxID=2052170 RepID=UPI003C795020
MDDRAGLVRRLKKIELTTNALVEGLQPGLHHSLFKGRGMEFAEIREYVPGDDVRSIDWKVTARYNHPFIREYSEERDQTFYFAVDISGSGTFGSGIPKQEKMLEVMACLAFAALRNNDRIGLCLFTDRVEKFLPAHRGKKHLVTLLNTLIDHEAVSPKTDLSAAARFLGTAIRRRSSMIILSDFMSPDVPGALKILSRRHEVITVRVTDVREQELPDVGTIALEDPETGEQVIVDTSDAAFRKQYAALVAESGRELAAGLSRAGIGYVSLLTTDSCEIPLNQFFRGMKQKRRKHGRLL